MYGPRSGGDKQGYEYLVQPTNKVNNYSSKPNVVSIKVLVFCVVGEVGSEG